MIHLYEEPHKNVIFAFVFQLHWLRLLKLKMELSFGQKKEVGCNKRLARNREVGVDTQESSKRRERNQAL